MQKKLAHIKIRTWLNFVVGLMFIVAAILVIFQVNYFMRQQALVEAESKARILLDRNLATHTYFTQILKPSLFRWTDPFRPNGYFDPSWMSSTYAVRQIDKYFKSFSTSDYYLKDAAVNARSPDNEADADERAFLDELKTDPKMVTRSYVRTLDGVPSFVFLRAGEVLEEACLPCHGDPNQAPADLVRLYGAERSFHRENQLGEVISAVSIRVPLSVAYAEANRFSVLLSGLLLALLVGLFLAQFWLNKRLLVAPLAAIRDKALQVSTDENRLGEQIPVPFGQELSEMATAFNRMSATLRRDRDRLEERIEARTADLMTANERLERDITERKQAEAALRESEERFRTLFEQAAVGVALLETKSGRYVAINHRYCDFLGYTMEEMLASKFQAVTHPDDVQTNLDNNALLMAGKIREFSIEKRYIRKGGTEVWGNLTVSPLWAAGEEPGTYFHIAVVQDITERKLSEQRAFELALERERMALLTKFILDVSHEFRTPLSIMQTNIYLLERLEDPAKRRRKLAQIGDQVTGITRLVELLVEMARLDSGVPFTTQPTDLNQLVGAVAGKLQSAVAAKDLTLHLELAADLPPVPADGNRLDRALRELLDNAMRYTPAGGSITVRTGWQMADGRWQMADSSEQMADVEPAGKNQPSAIGNRQWVAVKVQDTGPGIPPDVLPHIFERFYRQDVAHTTPGFGLGLPIARAIVERHGGRLDVESQPGVGSVFRIVLPA